MICPVCNKQLKDGAERCPNCRTSFYQPYGTPSQRNKKSKKIVAAVVAVILAVAIAGAAAMVILDKGKSPQSISAGTGGVTVRAKVNAETMGVDSVRGMTVAAYCVDVDNATGRESLRPDPTAAYTLGSDGAYELHLDPGSYAIKIYEKDTDRSELALDDTGNKNCASVVFEQKLRVNSDDDYEKNGGERFSTSSLMTDYRFGDFVDINGVAYYADSLGLHRDNVRYSAVLDSGECFRLATDGAKIYYSVVTEKSKLIPEGENPDAYDAPAETETEEDFSVNDDADRKVDGITVTSARCVIYSIGTDGNYRKKLFECRSEGAPLFVCNDKLYYLDRDVVGGTQCLYAYDIAKKTDKLIFKDVETVKLAGNKIFVKTFEDKKGRAYLRSYNFITEKILKTNVKINGFWIDRDCIFYTKSKGDKGPTSLYRRDTVDFRNNEPELIREFPSEMQVDHVNINHAFLHTSVQGLDTEEWDYAYYRYSIAADELKYIRLGDPDEEYFIHPYTGGVIYYTADVSEMYYLNNFSDVSVQCYADCGEGYFLSTVGNYSAYSCVSGEDGIKITKCDFTPPDFKSVVRNDTVEETVGETEEEPVPEKDIRYNLKEFWGTILSDKSFGSATFGQKEEIKYNGETYLLYFLSGIPKGEKKPVLIDWAFVDPENGECFDSL